MSHKSVRELLDYWKNAAPGFDALRLCLSMVIMLWHVVVVCYGIDTPVHTATWTHPAIKPILLAMLPMFFFLGGFLVTGSAYRLRSAGTFFIFRVFRIVPALFVEICLSALVLGALITTLPLAEYYTHKAFYTYFLNIFGFVHFFLPGVFTENPSQIVNINLWTLPPDFRSYAIMIFLMFTGIVFDRRLFLLVFVVAHVLIIGLLPAELNWADSGRMYVLPSMLIYAFFWGTFCYIFADKIKIRKLFMYASIAGLMFFQWKYTTMLGIISACYLTLCIGFMDLRKFPLVHRGDYSYGVYLYGFPIQQAVWHFLPAARDPVILFVLSVPITLAFSVFSWHLIEKPFLALRKKLPFIGTPKILAYDRVADKEGELDLPAAPPPEENGNGEDNGGDVTSAQTKPIQSQAKPAQD